VRRYFASTGCSGLAVSSHSRARLTVSFHTYDDGAEVYINPPTQTELTRYKNDCTNSAKQLYA
jgi:hypothetical protein